MTERASANGGSRLGLVLGLLVSAAGLGACATTTPQMAARGASPHVAPPAKPRTAAVRPAETAPGGRYKLGAPYQAAGLWYVPAEEPDYDEVGIASWYGDQFNGQATANGERFDMRRISAAHATLPMPSIVEVTNLDNGRTLRVRLNDRGPFKAGRIIDLSRAAAQELGYMEKGTARVRVRYVGPARLDGSLEPLYVARNDAPVAPPTPRQGPVADTWAIPSQAPVIAPVSAPVSAPSSAPVIAQSELPPLAPSASAPSRWASAEVAETGFAVQAGAFADRARAERVALALGAAGSAMVRPVEAGDRQLYRVVVGPWRDEDQAVAARAQVASLGFAEARVIKAF